MMAMSVKHAEYLGKFFSYTKVDGCAEISLSECQDLEEQTMFGSSLAVGFPVIAFQQ